MATVLDEYLIKFGFDVNTAGLDRMVSGLNASEKLFNTIRSPFDAFNNALWALGTITKIVIWPFKEFVNTATEAALAADQLAETASMLGIASKDMEFFGFAAEQAGTSASEMQFALKMLNREMAQAANGSKESAKSFKKYGIDIKDANGNLRSAGDVMQDATVKLAQIPNEAKRSAAAVDLFGKAGLGLKNFLAQTPEQIGELRNEFAAFGGDTSEKLQTLGNDYDNMLKKQKMAMGSFGRAFAVGLMPVINAFNKWIEDFLRKNGPSLRLFFNTLASTVAIVADFLGGILDTFYQAGEAVARFVARLAEAILKIDEVKVFIFALGAALAITFAPWTTLFTAIFLIVEDFLGFLEGKDSVIGDIVDAWQEWTASLADNHPWLNMLVGGIGALFDGLKLVVQMVYYLLEAFADGGFSKMWLEWVTAVTVAADAWRKIISDFFGWLLGGAANVGVQFGERLMGKLKGLAGVFGINVGGGASADSSSVTAPVGSVASSIMSSSSSKSTNNNVQAPITINMQPGQDGRDAANQVEKKFKEMFASEVRQSHPDVAYSR